ncbi:MAG: proline--tRNA ligase, partial [Nitrospirae bacterium]|nr:proline--tRNA ligase [Nitrospirota bacterium]
RETAERYHRELEAAGVEVLLDDRDERAGVKFKDADLIGIPYQVVFGEKGLKEGMVEIKTRRDGSVARVPVDEGVARLRVLLQTPSP